MLNRILEMDLTDKARFPETEFGFSFSQLLIGTYRIEKTIDSDIIHSGPQASGNAFCYVFEHLTSPKFL